MKRTRIKTALCATAAAFAALATSAQEAAPATPVQAPVQGSTTVSATTTPGPIMVRLGSEAVRVVDITGQSAGRVESLVLSPVGCTEAAIVATPNGRLMPVPWTAARVDTIGVGTGANTVAGAAPTMTINIDQARLAQAPTFTRTQLPAVLSTATWLQPSVAFFSAAVPAATGAAGTSSTISGGAGTSATATNAAGVTVTGGTATRVPTNSSAVLPPTGRPTQPGIPTTPATPTPATPTTPATPATPNSGVNSPASPTIPPGGTPAAPPPAAPRPNPPTQP